MPLDPPPHERNVLQNFDFTLESPYRIASILYMQIDNCYRIHVDGKQVGPSMIIDYH